MIQELALIRNALLRLLVSFVVFLGGFLFVPLPGKGETASALFIEFLRTTILPQGSVLAVTSPLDPFLTQATVAATFALALLIPIFFLELWHFVAPGLTAREKLAPGAGLARAFCSWRTLCLPRACPAHLQRALCVLAAWSGGLL
jgi:Sec-independent protein secretion pathway component TatC